MCSSESSHTTSTAVVLAPECVRFSVRNTLNLILGKNLFDFPSGHASTVELSSNDRIFTTCSCNSIEVENQLTKEYLSKKKMSDNVEEETTDVGLMYKSGKEKESCDTEDILLKSNKVNSWIIEANKTPTKFKHLDSKQRYTFIYARGLFKYAYNYIVFIFYLF